MPAETQTFQFTEEQEAVIHATRRGSGSVMVEAGAGCSKTTTATAAVADVRIPVLAVAFGKRNADDLKAKFPERHTIKSFNALGHQAWGRAIPSGLRLELDDRKIGKLTTQLAKEQKLELDRDEWDATRNLVELAMLRGLVPAEDEFAAKAVEDGWMVDTEESWEELALDCGISGPGAGALIFLAGKVLRQSIVQARMGKICFDDQIYCSVLLGGKFPRFPMVLVDEDQDLNQLQHGMVAASLAADGRLVAIGDKRQGIYAWRGASHDSAERLRALRSQGSWTDLPLMTTFRCPQAVVERQQKHVPGFRAAPQAPRGLFHHYRPPQAVLTWDGWGWTEITSHVLPGDRVTILCRNNAPLLSLAFKLIRQGIGCKMLGRDIGRGLTVLSRKLAPDDGMPADALRAEIERWRDNEIYAHGLADRPDRADASADRADCLLAVMDSGEARSAGELRQLLTKLFEQQGTQVTLSTIHKFKGLESEVVVVLDPWRTVPKRARELVASGSATGIIELEQALNLKYVSETRTRRVLLQGDLRDFH